MGLAEKFIELRAKYNLSQKDLCKMLGMKYSTQVSRIETKKHKMHAAREKRILYDVERLEVALENGEISVP